ncbi:MAG: efflux RND transporter periplasmic adaptor subunit [Ekhidna sp.]
MKIAKYIGIVITALSIISCGTGDQTEGMQLPPIQVEVSTGAAILEADPITASGKIEAKNSANLSTRMMGVITKLNVSVGEKVRKGQQLLVISNSDLIAKKSQVEASILQATSAFQNAEKDYMRFKTLFEKESASEKELDDMATRYEIAKANLTATREMKKEIEAQFTYTNIASPFNGVVINTFLKPGDMANPGMPLIAVEGTNEYQATALVSEVDISKIKKGSEALVLVKSPGKELQGTVTEVSPSAKNTGGQYLVKIDLNGEMEGVLPGMFANVKFPGSNLTSSQRVSVPKAALVKQGQLTGIYAISNDQTAILRWLRIGKEDNGRVEVLSGLKANERFIVSAEGKLYNGAKVVVETNKNAQ